MSVNKVKVLKQIKYAIKRIDFKLLVMMICIIINSLTLLLLLFLK